MAGQLELDDFDREVLGLAPLRSGHLDEHPERWRPLEFFSVLGSPAMLNPPDGYNTQCNTALVPGISHVSGTVRRMVLSESTQTRPDTASTISSAPTYRVRELHGSFQQETPLLNSSSYSIESPSAGPTTITLPAPGSSSPTTRLGVRKQKTVGALLVDGLTPYSTSPLPIQRPRVDQTDPQPSTPIVHGIPLISLRRALPDKFRAIFPYELFNAVQSKCFNIVYGSNDNVVVAAPTGSGKTAILELAICKLALNRGNENFKIVYQAPTKALCAEKARDWDKKFSHMNLKCAELTGDTSQAEMRRVGDASIIVTTPEKWDSITRKWHDHRRLLQMVELFLIDEVHILKDARGATLEAVVSRMKTIGANVRFVALSATVPNSDDIAKWLGRNHTNQQLPAHRETFGEEFRPVKLQKFVYGFESSSNDFTFDKFLGQKLPGLISRHAQQKPILVFCFTRKSCENTAAILAEFASGRPDGENLWPVPSQRVPVISRELQEIVKFGVAFHHAGLDTQDRSVIEQNFLKGQLGVICCTSTLAVGINLPCHTVVLKGTVGFTDERLEEYSDLEVMQMLGRAGRPQFDDSAIAIILTRAANKARYQKMVTGQETLESTLHLNLIEHLNSEICLGTISNLSSAKTWLGGTFLSVRLRHNPGYYQLTGGLTSPSQIDDKLEEICERDIKQLQEAELVTKQNTLTCTEYGRAMSKYLVEFQTMKLLLQIPRAVGMEALITTLSQATEFKEFRFKPAERSLFREINQSPLILFPIKETVNQTRHKISLMIQAHLGCVQYPDSPEAAKVRRQLMVERKLVFERLNRLIRAVIDCKGHDRDATSTKNALELARALAAESWEGRATQLTQIPNIGPAGMRKLASKDIRTVLELVDKEYDEIERLMSRQPPFGKKLRVHLERFPRLAMDVVMVDKKIQPRSQEPVVIHVKATLRYLNSKGLPNWLGRVPPLTFLAESGDGTLVYFWRGSMRKLESQSGFELKFSVGLRNVNACITCHFSCEEIVGTIVSRTLKPNLPASIFPSPPTATASGQGLHSRNIRRECLDSDGIGDIDLLLAAEQALSHPSTTTDVKPTIQVEYDEYTPVEDLLNVSSTERLEAAHHCEHWYAVANHDYEDEVADTQAELPGPVQLPNGKWKCNHVCSGGAPTKSGKPCSHRCCNEGIDKPRKRPSQRPKRKAEEFTARDTVDATGAGRVQAQMQQPSKVTHIPPAGSRVKRQKVQRMEPLTKPTCPSWPNQLDPSNIDWQRMDFDVMDIECIDLSFTDDEEGGPSKPSTSGPRDSSKPAREVTAKAAVENHTREEKHKQGTSRCDVAVPNQTVRSRGTRICEEEENTAAPFSQRQDDYFDDDEFSFLDQELSPPGLISPTPAVTPFKSGASDEILYQGILKKFAEARSGAAPDGHSVSETTTITSTGPVFAHPSSSIPVEESLKLMAVDQQADSTATTGPGLFVADAVVGTVPEELRPPKQDNEPDWVAEFDPEFVDMFRGYVTFV
ncbi:ATP-dependent DNA helicase MER3 [Madurella fahalii]|uniref:DNA 3'-5' helicase n=1 Tax=Madurella fahalii TaxID=1157608 RepID=A0ABQ0GCF7_9PEZI